jgi:hypothetical protein
MYANRKIRPVETILGMRGGEQRRMRESIQP